KFSSLVDGIVPAAGFGVPEPRRKNFLVQLEHRRDILTETFRRQAMRKRNAVALAVLALISACGGSSSRNPDRSAAVLDGPGGGGRGTAGGARIGSLHIDEQKALTGLSAPVDVVRDTRGVPHIYGQSINDVVRVEGYLMARDRFPQMEFIRRGVLGRLSEVAGNVVPNITLPNERRARLTGSGR